MAPARQQDEASPFASAADLRDVLTRVLSEIDRDSKLGQRLTSAHASYRFVFSDPDLILNLAESEDPDRCIRWSFSDDVEWKPALTLEMSSAVANRFLQGSENLAIAVARRRIRCSSDVRSALTLLPITRELAECYRAVIEREFPHLLLP